MLIEICLVVMEKKDFLCRQRIFAFSLLSLDFGKSVTLHFIKLALQPTSLCIVPRLVENLTL